MACLDSLLAVTCLMIHSPCHSDQRRVTRVPPMCGPALICGFAASVAKGSAASTGWPMIRRKSVATALCRSHRCVESTTAGSVDRSFAVVAPRTSCLVRGGDRSMPFGCVTSAIPCSKSTIGVSAWMRRRAIRASGSPCWRHRPALCRTSMTYIRLSPSLLPRRSLPKTPFLIAMTS